MLSSTLTRAAVLASACVTVSVVVGDAPANAAVLCGGKAPTIVASPGVETVGTQGSDVILGTQGPDTIRGLAGRDLICGRGGVDTLRGGKDDDRLFGGASRDLLVGGHRDDRIFGGPGRDQLRGRKGFDAIHGGPEPISVSEARGRISSSAIKARTCCEARKGRTP